MKKAALSVAVLIAVCLFFGCSKKDNNSSNSGIITPVSPAYNNMTDTINGGAFFAVHCISGMSDNVLSISGENAFTGAGFVIMEVNIAGYSGIGTYTISPSSGTTASIDSASGSTPSALYGRISITATSPFITGTFSFTCRDSTKVTSGNFECVP